MRQKGGFKRIDFAVGSLSRAALDRPNKIESVSKNAGSQTCSSLFWPRWLTTGSEKALVQLSIKGRPSLNQHCVC